MYFAFVLESLHFKKEDIWTLTAVVYAMREPFFSSEKNKKIYKLKRSFLLLKFEKKYVRSQDFSA